MKTLTLLRHAKSGWDEPVSRDFDRPLGDRGQRAAVVMGHHMRDIGLRFDRVIASPAVRCVETLDQLWQGYGRSIPPELDKRVYLASAPTLIDLIQDGGDPAERLLLCGHNPGMEDLVLALTPEGGGALRDAVEEKFPTAAIAVLEFDVESWSAIRPGTARLTRFIRPRDVDPALGPEVNA